MRDRYGYAMRLARPPHYVDKIAGGFTSYDVYDRMGYQYMAASYDGGGWLPSPGSGEEALAAEARAMVEPMERALAENPDVFCGQIIFQKDGYNMARRTPVAFALGSQLALLQKYGYQVVTASGLLTESPFRDLGREDPLFEKMERLARDHCVVFDDNRLRLEAPMTQGELAMLLAPRQEAVSRREALIRRKGKAGPYAGAMEYCREARLLPADARPSEPVRSLPEELFETPENFTRRAVYRAYKMENKKDPPAVQLHRRGIADCWRVYFFRATPSDQTTS